MKHHRLKSTDPDASVSSENSDIEDVFRSYSKVVYRYLLSLCHDPVLSEDLTQDTFLKAMLNIDQYRGESSLNTWLCSIARRCFIDWTRKSGDLFQQQLDKNLPEKTKEMRDLDLLSLIHKLPEPYREILYLRLFGSLSFREIGQILERSENWARVMFYRGKEKLKEELL